jgi:hypothetical protein
MEIAFVYHHPAPQFWFDGLHMAIEELKKDYTIHMVNLAKDDGIHGPVDFALGWGAFGSPADIYLRSIEGKKGLCLGGNATPVPTEKLYDVIFYETDWTRKHYLQFVDDTKTLLVKAFGINSEIYNRVDIPTPIVFDYLGVGSFSAWKRWEKIIQRHGMRMVVGEYQIDNEMESLGIIRELVRNDVMVSPMVHPFDLSNFYHWTRTVYIPATVNGGGERSVLEARACGCSVEVEEDNPKLKELTLCDIMTYKDYAQALKEGIQAVL